MRALAATLVVSMGIGGALVACGGDDQFVQPGTTDGGAKTDGGTTDGGHTGDGGPVTDGGDSGCNFTAFVIDQVTNHTAENTAPVANASIPDPTCSLTGTTGDYSALFTK